MPKSGDQWSVEVYRGMLERAGMLKTARNAKDTPDAREDDRTVWDDAEDGNGLEKAATKISAVEGNGAGCVIVAVGNQAECGDWGLADQVQCLEEVGPCLFFKAWKQGASSSRRG